MTDSSASINGTSLPNGDAVTGHQKVHAQHPSLQSGADGGAAAAAAAPLATEHLLAGHVGHLSEEQEQNLNAFKALLYAQGLYKADPPSHDDVTLLRYLRARRWDKAGALKQMKETEQWRAEAQVDHFFENHDIAEYEEARKVYPCWTGRRTKKGVPFYIYRVNELDKKTMDRYLSSSDSKKSKGKRPPSVVALYESLLKLVLPMSSKMQDRPNLETPISSSCNIVDITDVSLSRFFHLRGHLGDASALATSRYPETLDSILVLGAPPYIETVFHFISKWFDANTRAKIQIVPYDKDAALKRLSEFIQIDDIPKVYGGNLDWNFGDLPNLDPAIVQSFGLDAKRWPIGPICMQGDDIVAMGSQKDGTPRREVLGTHQAAAKESLSSLP